MVPRILTWSLLAGLQVLFCAGCSTPGVRVESVAGLIGYGEPREDVHQTFGAPTHTLRGANGKTLDQYRSSSNRSRFTLGLSRHDGDLQLGSLDILYDTEGRVENYQFHRAELPYDENLWGSVEISAPVETAALVNVKPGETTREELLNQFRTPAVIGLDLEGHTTVQWFHWRKRPFREGRAEELTVTLNSANVVTDYYVREGDR